MFCQMVILNL